MMNKLQPFSRKIAKIFVTIAACLLAFYSLVVELTVHYAENLNSQTRLSVIAPSNVVRRVLSRATNPSQPHK
ncbi:hypothetical protein ACMAZF_03360 [Psychrobium sp. nBUS_13]|uniref:hypothetical protein n=1 Tax=Psychrobium sp. nBUS_13 TaxID=3395319 RepID=UPI003EB90647